MHSPKAIVIGAGIAGIATALRLRHKGYAVEVFEANPYTGGKLHAFESGGYRFDAGPSLFTMPQLVDELFNLFGENPRIHFPYIRKERVCTYSWDDGTRFTVPADVQKFIRDAAHTFGVESDVLERYLINSREKYELTAPLFLERSLHRFTSYLDAAVPRALLRMHRLDTATTLDAVNRRYFQNPKLVQLFNRYATYNGSSPFRTPGIMSMIPHLEMHFGTFLPARGMHDISQSLTRLAERHGVVFRLNEGVDEILVRNNAASGVRTRSGEYLADRIISNMDVLPTYRKLLRGEKQPEPVLARERSGSALIFYWGVRRVFPELDLHNIFFSRDYAAEFDAQFKGTLADDLTVYVNITSKDIPGDAPAGSENWFVMVNAPSDTGQDWSSLRNVARESILRKLSHNLGVDIAPLIEVEEVLDPPLIQQRTSSHQGSLYGTSSNSRFAAFLRHPNFSSRIRNLYFCGGSVHPGGGIPLCLHSARIVADQMPKV
ncbi:MAG: 1-hydroxycarotenoid 3,4-desaturase CrtD [Bacteroidota bacterium]